MNISLNQIWFESNRTYLTTSSLPLNDQFFGVVSLQLLRLVSWRIRCSYMFFEYVSSQSISWPYHFVTEVARDWQSFQMMCFNVPRYVSYIPFFSTNFANFCSSLSISNLNLIFTCLHHFFDIPDICHFFYTSKIFGE